MFKIFHFTCEPRTIFLSEFKVFKLTKRNILKIDFTLNRVLLQLFSIKIKRDEMPKTEQSYIRVTGGEGGGAQQAEFCICCSLSSVF